MVELREAGVRDLDALTAIEAACFPPEEGASRESFAARLDAFPEGFLIAEENGRAVGMIDGMVTDCETIEDRLYEDATLHDPNGAWQSVFGLAVHPDHQHKGIASQLMRAFIEKARKEGRKGMMLTCKAPLIPFYEQFGFASKGVSASVHGGVVWYDMVLSFSNEGKEGDQGGAGKPAPKRRRAAPKTVLRTRYVHFRDAEELGALIRTRRSRLGMNLGDAAICCGVGRRFLLDLEAGKPTAQFDKILQVLDTFGMGLALTGTGASFTEDDLQDATVNRQEITWEAEFERGAPDTASDDELEGRRGRPVGAKRLSDEGCRVKIVDLRREAREKRRIEREERAKRQGEDDES